MPFSDLQIAPVTSAGEFRAFLKLPYRLYQNDPHWIAPLYWERRDFLHPKRNPFYRHGTVQLFLAIRRGIPVGRISAQIDHLHEKQYGERIGFFGFLETERDPEISSRLFEKAEAFLKERGCGKVRGPFSFSINQEAGLLVEGFSEPLMTMTPYNPAYYPFLVENSGYLKVKDLLAWGYHCGDVPEIPLQIAQAVEHTPGLAIRHFHAKRALEDTQKIFEVFNSAWSENWGFVPMTPDEIRRVATELRWFADPRHIFIAEMNGDPAGVCLTVPNAYDLVQGLNGALLPFGFAKFLYRLKRPTWQSMRCLLLGVKKEYRGLALGGLSFLLYVKSAQMGLATGKIFGELSWTLEDNESINSGIEFMGGKKTKVFRVYEKELS